MRPLALTEEQRRLYDLARAELARRDLQWTDEYPGDPAAAVLELAVLLTDLQSQELEESRDYGAFVKLLGGKPRRRRPARLLARTAERGGVYPGQRFYADGVPFDVADAGKDAGEIATVRLRSGGTWSSWDGRSPLTVPGRGCALELTFTDPLPARERLRLWCGVTPEPGRIPPNGGMDPPLTLRGVLPEGSAFPVLDGTCGLLQAGFWTFTLASPVRCFTVELEGEPEGRPQIADLALEPALLLQQRTRSAVADLTPPFLLPVDWEGTRILRFFLPAGDGWRETSALVVRDGRVSGWRGTPPETVRVAAAEADFSWEFPLREIAGERISLHEEGVLPRSLRLMVEEDGVWYDCPRREPYPFRTFERGWRWDESRREICFGDGRDFRLPKAGRVLIAGCACTLGAAGNGAAPDDPALIPLAPSAGGQDEETPEAAFFRTVREEEPLRAVTAADFEALARSAPGLALAKVRAVPGKNGMTVLAQPRSEDPLPVLTPWEAARLSRWLERFRMIGVPVEVRGPRYVPVDVSAVLQTDSRAAPAVLRETAGSLIDGAWEAAELSQAALFAALGSVPGVRAAVAVELFAEGLADRDGVIRLEPDMLPYLRNFRVRET